MELLEHFYENRPHNSIYYPRKLYISNDESEIYLYGGAGVGKTSTILDFIDSLDENILYIDCQEPIFLLEDIDLSILNEFIKAEAITTLVLDHYFDNFLEDRPSVDRLIVVSRKRVAPFNIKKSYHLYPLDYEEFLGFVKGGSVESIFNQYIKLGTLPLVVSTRSKNSFLALRSLFFSSFSENQSRLLLILAKFQSRRVNTHQIYNSAKEYFKISKDLVYKSIKSFEEEGIIIFIDDIEGGRRLFIYDFALTRYLNYKQPFIVTFDTMVALSLYKHGIVFKAFGSRGYISEGGEFITLSLFETQEALMKRLKVIYKKLLKFGIKKISIVTVSAQYSSSLNGIKIEALPFFEWSILND